jgi:TPR repeat protein
MVWLRKAAEHNYSDAETIIGKMYWNGRGVTQDRVEADKWYRRAADHDDS